MKPLIPLAIFLFILTVSSCTTAPNFRIDATTQGIQIGDTLILTHHLLPDWKEGNRDTFIATKEGKFDVYSAGGLGNHARFGVKVAEAVEPEMILYYIKAMWLTFRAYGNYENRGKARTRYMQEICGSAENYAKAYQEKLAEVLASGEDLKVSVEPQPLNKKDNGVRISGVRILPQKQNGLYTVIWHPIGGQPKVEELCALSDAIQDMEEVEIRLAPDETAYIINLNGSEVEKVLEATPSSANTVFETSVSCIGASICQVGLRDSQALLQACVDAVRKADIQMVPCRRCIFPVVRHLVERIRPESSDSVVR